MDAEGRNVRNLSNNDWDEYDPLWIGAISASPTAPVEEGKGANSLETDRSSPDERDTTPSIRA